MIPTDHLYGSFEGYETEIKQNEDGTFTASGLGRSVTDRFQEVAIDKLNHEIYDAVTRGELVPNMGN